MNQDGSQVRLRDVAKVELGGEKLDVVAKFNGKPALRATGYQTGDRR
ncbi:efflux RND transporter permease subunit [Shigella flexneri]